MIYRYYSTTNVYQTDTDHGHLAKLTQVLNTYL